MTTVGRTSGAHVFSRLNSLTVGLIWVTALMLFIQPLAAELSCTSCRLGRHEPTCRCAACEKGHTGCGCRAKQCVHLAHPPAASTFDNATSAPWRPCHCPPGCPCQLRNVQQPMLAESRGVETRESDVAAWSEAPCNSASGCIQLARQFTVAPRLVHTTSSELCAVFCRFTI